MLPWNLRQLISYFFALIIYSINLLKTARKTFATGNAIYALPRTIIQITNANSIFRKEGIETLKTVILWIITQFRHTLLYAYFFSKKKKKAYLSTFIYAIYPPLLSMGRPTANKDIFKSGLVVVSFIGGGNRKEDLEKTTEM